jgi:mRNA-degrading endonuclease RelE of RelBE toxin-antitoxin system
MAAYQIEMTEMARTDLQSYTVFEQKVVVSGVRTQLTHQPGVATRNRKRLRDNPLAPWALRVGKYRILYEIHETSRTVIVVAIGHKEHDTLFIRGDEVNL